MKLFQIKKINSEDIIFQTKAESIKNCVENAVANCVDLIDADLSNTNLAYANLTNAKLRYVDFNNSNLSNVNFNNADLKHAYLRQSNLRGANLRGANISNCYLRCADFTGANFDFGCFPLCCGSFEMKTDKKFRIQLLYHLLNLEKCADDKLEELNTDELRDLANKFHKINTSNKL